MRVIFRILWLVLTKYRYRVIVGYVSVVGAALSALAIPQVLGTSVNKALESGEKDPSQLYLLALILLLAGTGRGLFSLGQMYIGESTSQKFAYDIRNAYYDRLQHLSFAFHDKQSTGSLMSRATADVEGIRMFINMGAIRFGFVFAMVLGIGVCMLLIDVRLALVSLSFVPFLSWRAVVTSKALRRVWMRVQELTGELVSVLQENLTGIRVVKAFAAEEYEKEKFRIQSRKVAHETLRAQQLWAGNFATMNFGFISAIGAILWVGGAEVIGGREVVDGAVRYNGLTPGELTAFIFYMGLLTMPVRMMGWMVNSFSRAASCGQRVFEILDAYSPVLEKPEAISAGRLRGHIVFENVSFGYEGIKQEIQSVSLDVPSGQTVALLGRPGSGKSTLAHLLLRFYDVTEGRITLDGSDIKDLTLASLRDNIGIVQQDVFIHAMSIQENIAYGRADATLEEVSVAAKIAQLDGFITSLPESYNTAVGERGVSLSGGQKQRLSIARTILRDPPILILDDSTSSVDAHTEHELQTALNAIIKDRTTFIITHRLSTIQNADTILVFRDGTVVERGTHADLMALGGEYRDLYEFQLLPQEEASLKETEVHGSGGLHG
jgi:ATP-binding cassette subfamily B multidrug efflux pump